MSELVPTLTPLPETHPSPNGTQQPRSEDPSSQGDASSEARERTSQGMPQRGRSRPWLYALGGSVVVGLGVLLFRPTPLPVDIAEVDQGGLEVTIVEEGQTRVHDRFVVSAPVAGRLQRLELKEGDTVEAQQMIARLDPLPALSQVQSLQAQIRELQAQKLGVETQRPKSQALSEAEARIRAATATGNETLAQVQEAQAALNKAQRDRLRAEDLYQDGAIAQQALEDAQMEEISRNQTLTALQRQVERNQAEVLAARADLERLQAEQQDPDYLLAVYDSRILSLEAELANLVDEAQRTEIPAPISGQVLRIYQESNRFVEAGTPLLELGNPSQLEFVVDVLSEDAVRIQPGALARIVQWGGEVPLVGRVRTIEPSAFTEVSALGVEEQRVNVIIDLATAAPNLGDGYRAEAQIIVWYNEGVVKVPIGALFRCEPSWCVFVVEEDNRAQSRSIELGQRNASEAQVTEGLTPGERVILHPSENIKAGSLVRSRDTNAL